MPATLPPEAPRSLPAPVRPGTPLTALAPMQNVTDLAFMEVVAERGVPDLFVTEYFSVHANTHLDPDILVSITGNRTGRPVFAQLLGHEPEHFLQAAEALAAHPHAGIDINLGCPAPKIYRRNAGGGLLRDPAYVARLLATLREAVTGRFTVKCRLGFEDTGLYREILDAIREARPDMVTVHGRTVAQMYRGEVDLALIRLAVGHLPCPVLANGNVTSAPTALRVLRETGAAGVMIGRAAIRNPWIFRQFREAFHGEPLHAPTLGDVNDYLEDLYERKARPEVDDRHRIAHLKRYFVFVGEGVDADGGFLHDIRRVKDRTELRAVCRRYLLDGGNRDRPFALEPFANLKARPNRE